MKVIQIEVGSGLEKWKIQIKDLSIPTSENILIADNIRMMSVSIVRRANFGGLNPFESIPDDNINVDNSNPKYAFDLIKIIKDPDGLYFDIQNWLKNEELKYVFEVAKKKALSLARDFNINEILE